MLSKIRFTLTWLLALTAVPTAVGVAQSDSLPPALATRCAAAPEACALLRDLNEIDSTTAAQRDWAHARLVRAKRVVDENGQQPLAWYALAVADLVASRAKVIASTGPLQVTGMTHEAGAGRALLRALELDSGFVAAAEALALLPRPREGVSELARALPTLRRYRLRLSGGAQLAAARKDREAGSLDEALAWLDAIAPGGVAAGVIALERTRVLYLMGRADSASAAYYAGIRDGGVETQRAYRSELAQVAEPAELAVWDTLAAAARVDWVRGFWNARDAAEGWPTGTRLREHYRRVEDAWQRYRLTIPTTGVHQMLTRSLQFDFAAQAELDRLYAAGGGVDDTVDVAALAALNAEKDLVGGGGLLWAFTGSVEGLDDRGLVLIRQGEPDKVARTVGGEAIELWRYDRATGPLLLTFREANFDGQVGPSVLAPTAMGADRLQRNQLCHLDSRLCSGDNDPRSQFLTTGRGTRGGVANAARIEATRLGNGVLLAEARDEGLAAIRTATTTDAHDRHFDRALDARVVFYGLQSRHGAAVVVGFAIPGDRLRGQAIEPGGSRVGYRLRFVVEAARLRDGLVRRVDTLRALAAPHALGAGEYLTGLLELPLPPGRYAVSLLTMDDQGGGNVVSLSRIAVPDAAQPDLSDLVLAAPGNGARWTYGDDTIMLNPLNTFRQGGEVDLYTQVLNAPAEAALPIRVEVWSSDTTVHEPRLALAFERRSTGAVTPIRQTLGLAKLAPGRYRLRLIARVAARDLVNEAWLTVVK
jgi:hypothetical protein